MCSLRAQDLELGIFRKENSSKVAKKNKKDLPPLLQEYVRENCHHLRGQEAAMP